MHFGRAWSREHFGPLEVKDPPRDLRDTDKNTKILKVEPSEPHFSAKVRVQTAKTPQNVRNCMLVRLASEFLSYLRE